jgi:hypothetical protein
MMIGIEKRAFCLDFSKKAKYQRTAASLFHGYFRRP